MKWRYPIQLFTAEEPLLSVKAGESKNLPTAFKEALRLEADGILRGEFLFFFHDKVSVGEIDWHKIYKSESQRVVFNGEHWSESYALLKKDEDVKYIWELSRFYWVLVLVRAYLALDDKIYLNKANQLLKDWLEKNPVNQGINWSCAQETSYRVINVLMGSFLLGSRFTVNMTLCRFVESHLGRIYGTLGYALSQKNNHGTTEAAALFIGGAWLVQNAKTDKQKKLASKCEKKGRQTLERLSQTLIQSDGSFSMYSTNYHRVIMQTFSFVLYAIDALGLQKLSDQCLSKIERLLDFQELITNEQSGKVPNIGANDGSYLMKLNCEDYKNFIPSNQVLRTLLFSQKRKSESIVEDLYWLKRNKEVHEIPDLKKEEKNLKDFGLLKIIGGNCATGFLKYPVYQFRPSHDDIGHFDFWLDGINQLCDAGTYSYVVTKKAPNVMLSSEVFHNSLFVVGEPKLRKLTQFLYLDWPQERGELQKNSAFCSYNRTYEFNRKVSFYKNECRIIDHFKTENSVTINWNLAVRGWELINERHLSNKKMSIEIQCKEDVNVDLKSGFMSPYYGSLEAIQTLLIEHPAGAGSLETILRW